MISEIKIVYIDDIADLKFSRYIKKIILNLIMKSMVINIKKHINMLNLILQKDMKNFYVIQM